MRRLAFCVQVPDTGFVVFAAPRLNRHEAQWLATFTGNGAEWTAKQYARVLNELAETFMPPKRSRAKA